MSGGGKGEGKPPSPTDLHAPGFGGIEASAPLIEIRLALSEWRRRHGPYAWQVHMPAAGSA